MSWTKIPAPKSEDKPIPVYGRSIEDDVENSCSIVNVAFNPTVLNDSQLKKVAMELAFDYIEQQNNTKVNRNEYSILKESRYFGDLNQIQKFISVKKESPETLEASMIDSDLPENLIQKLTNLSTKKSASTTTNETNKHVVIEELKSTPPQTLKLPIYEEKVKDSFYTLKIHLPLVESFSECELNIDSVNKSILLDVQNTYKNLMIPFGHLEGSFIVDTSQIQAKFVRKDRILKVKIPLISNLSK